MIVFALCVLCLFSDILSSSSLHIGHSIEEQKNWHRIHETYAKCAYGTYQTPIHIEDHHIEHIVMPSLELTGYHNYLAPPLALHNNGHTVKLTIGDFDNSSLYERPRVSGALLSSSYVFESLHFHWGEKNDRGSEHVLNHLRYPMEMHLVHRNMKYNTTFQALDHKDGLVVLGFMFQVQISDNRKLRPIINKLKEVRATHLTTNLKHTFTLANLLPRDLDIFYTYEGSLTTPPCSEAVTWFVFPEAIPISFNQMEHFRKLEIQNNYRVLQPVGQRRIYMRKNSRFVMADFDDFNRNDVSARRFWLH